MSSPLAFTPLGPTFARTVTAASQALSPTLTTPPAVIAPLTGNVDYRFTVVGTQAVWIAYGTTAPTAAIPADGATGQGFMIEGGLVQIQDGPPLGTGARLVGRLAGHNGQRPA